MRYIVSKDGRTIGAIHVSRSRADRLREHGYQVLPA